MLRQCVRFTLTWGGAGGFPVPFLEGEMTARTNLEALYLSRVCTPVFLRLCSQISQDSLVHLPHFFRFLGNARIHGAGRYVEGGVLIVAHCRSRRTIEPRRDGERRVVTDQEHIACTKREAL